MHSFLQSVASWFNRKSLPPHLQVGQLGEKAARKYLTRQGLKFLTANFRTDRGEIDVVMRDKVCLVFVEVKTRSSEEWSLRRQPSMPRGGSGSLEPVWIICGCSSTLP